MFGNYIFTENGSTIYAYIVKKVKDETVKNPHEDEPEKILMTKLYGT